MILTYCLFLGQLITYFTFGYKISAIKAFDIISTQLIELRAYIFTHLNEDIYKIMTWEAFNSIIQSISALLVSITLFFTYRQIKEASKQTKNLEMTLRTSVAQNVTQGQREIWNFLLEDQDLLKWYLQRRGVPIGTSDIENKIKGFAALKMDFYESLYLQYQQDNVSKETWMSWFNAMKLDLQDPIFQEVWLCMKNKQLYAPSFIRLIDNNPNLISDI